MAEVCGRFGDALLCADRTHRNLLIHHHGRRCGIVMYNHDEGGRVPLKRCATSDYTASRPDASSIHSVATTTTNGPTLYREITAVCSEIHKEHINTVCGGKCSVV